MTRQQMIDVLVVSLMITRDKQDKEEGIESILRRGFRGFNNLSDEELKKLTCEYDKKDVEGLLLASELIQMSKPH